MKKKEKELLAELGASDLAEKEKQLREAQWKLRLQKATGQLENPAKLTAVRRDIARVKTWRRAVERKGEGA